VKNKKIVHIVLNPFTHDSRVIRECKSLANEGYNVTVIAYWMEGSELEESEYGYKIIRIPIITKSWSTNPLIQIIKYIEFLIKSLLIIRNIKPDICHGHNPDGFLIGYFSKLFWQSKLIYDSHELWGYTSHLNSSSSILYKIGIFIEKSILVKADSIITVNDSIARLINNKIKINNIFVIRNFPEYVSIKHNYTKEHLPLSHLEFNMIYVGSLGEGRGIEILIKSMVKVNENIGLILVGGSAKMHKKYESMILDNKLVERVSIIPIVSPSDVLDICHQADLGIHPIENTCLNHYYSLPNKIFQYIQAGIPVLCSNFPEMKNIVNKYSVGEVFNIDEPSSLIKVINNYFDNPDNIIRYKQNCLKASKVLNWDNEEKQLFNLYNQL